MNPTLAMANETNILGRRKFNMRLDVFMLAKVI